MGIFIIRRACTCIRFNYPIMVILTRGSSSKKLSLSLNIQCYGIITGAQFLPHVLPETKESIERRAMGKLKDGAKCGFYKSRKVIRGLDIQDT